MNQDDRPRALYDKLRTLFEDAAQRQPEPSAFSEICKLVKDTFSDKKLFTVEIEEKKRTISIIPTSNNSIHPTYGRVLEVLRIHADLTDTFNVQHNTHASYNGGQVATPLLDFAANFNISANATAIELGDYYRRQTYSSTRQNQPSSKLT